jgi:hypothetical protein
MANYTNATVNALDRERQFRTRLAISRSGRLTHSLCRRRTTSICARRTAGADVELSLLWQARFAQTLDDALEILGVLVWQHLATML